MKKKKIPNKKSNEENYVEVLFYFGLMWKLGASTLYKALPICSRMNPIRSKQFSIVWYLCYWCDVYSRSAIEEEGGSPLGIFYFTPILGFV